MNHSCQRFLVSLFLTLWVCAAQSQPAFAQRSGSSETDLLKRSDVQEQLGLSADQITKISEFQKASSPGREIFDPFLARMKAVETEAERSKIREEMNQAIAAAKSSFQNNSMSVLNESQRRLLRSLYVREVGVRALLNDQIAEELNLSEEQKASLQKLRDEQRDASRTLGFNASDEERSKFETTWTEKTKGVLTPDQRTQFEKLSETTDKSAVAVSKKDSTAPSTASSSTPALTPPSAEPPPGESVVASFQSETASEPSSEEAADSSSSSKPETSAAGARKFSFNFRYAPWDQVLTEFATAAGLTLDLTVTPPGTFSHLDNSTYTANETLDVLNGYLLRKGYAILRKDGFLVCVNVDKGISPELIPDVPLENLSGVGENEIVRIELAIADVDVAVMAQEVESLLGPQGKMTAFTQTGTLIVSDTGANLRRIRKFLDNSLQRRKPDDLIFRSYHLKNISAEEAEILLMTQFGMRQGATNVSSATEERGNRDRRQPEPVQPASASSPPLQLAADSRTNSLFVTGTAKQQTLVEEIINAIDVSEAPDGTPLGSRSNSAPYLKVYTVSGVDAGEVTKSLDSMMPGVVINEDSRAGRIHIWGTERQHQQVEEWIRQFDGRGGSGSVAVIPLVRMDPLTASATLRSLFLSEGNSAPTIESDLTGRRLIVKGSADQIAQIRTVLTGLGEDGTGVRQNSQSGPVRRFSLQGRNPDEFLRYLQQSWESTERTPIRVIIPGNQGPIRDRRTPGKPETNPQRSESLPEESKDRHRDSTSQNRLRDRVLMTSSQTEPADSNETETTDAASNGAESNGEQPSQSEPEATEPESTDGIRVLVHGDELILSSSDEAALDRMESLLESLHQSLPQRSTWTVFYLQAADATETATMLEQIFPASSVTKTAAEGGLSFSSMFRPVTDTVSNMTGLSSLSTSPQVLRIIPDIRSNSLFVTGPEMLIRDVEEVLKVLDASDLPESLREMQPRMIEVRYADINEVSQIVNEVFKPYLEAPAAARQQANPFAALMGGGNRGNSESAQVRMTIGVDTQTSTLIVSSSEALFTQVQELVGNLDESSRSANRQVKVVQLKNADVADVQESLTSLFPRVRTNVSQSTTGGSSEGGNSRGQASERERSGNNNQDPFQQMLQERFRQRAAEMGGGGRNGGGGLPGDFGGRGGFNNGNRGSQNGAGNQGRGQQGRRGNR